MELERTEPRVVSLHEAAKAVFKTGEIPERFTLKYSQLSELRLKLQSLIKLTGIYILKLGSVLGKDPNEISSPLPSPFGTSLQTMNYDVSLIKRCTILQSRYIYIQSINYLPVCLVIESIGKVLHYFCRSLYNITHIHTHTSIFILIMSMLLQYCKNKKNREGL